MSYSQEISVSWTWECDRCATLFRDMMDTVSDHNVNPRMGPLPLNWEQLEWDDNYDLCIGCARDLTAFLSGTKLQGPATV